MYNAHNMDDQKSFKRQFLTLLIFDIFGKWSVPPLQFILLQTYVEEIDQILLFYDSYLTGVILNALTRYLLLKISIE